MLRIYYTLLPLDYKRPGGVWWYKSICKHEYEETIKWLQPIALNIRVSEKFIDHDPMNIFPPDCAKIIKGETL